MNGLMPIIIFGGSDSYRETVPEGLSADDMLSGFKGAVCLPSGRCIAGELIQRIRQSGRFREPVLIGPRDAYEALLDCEVVDVRGNLPATIEAAEAIAEERYGLSHPFAVSACDVLPSGAEFRQLLEEGYDPHPECGLWWQLVAAEPSELGASGWKPNYRVAPSAGESPVTLYPGHLVIVRPEALRLKAFKRFLSLAYRYRNRALYERVTRMTLRALSTMLQEDVSLLASGRWSARTFSVPYMVLRAYGKLRTETMTVRDLEAVAAKVLLDPAFQRRKKNRPVVFAVTRIQSFAKDIDTRAELEEAVRRTRLS